MNRNRFIAATAALIVATGIAVPSAHADLYGRPPAGPTPAKIDLPKPTQWAQTFLGAPVANAAATRPGQAMLVTDDALSQIRGYLPESLATSPDLPEQYQTETEIQAKDDYEREQGDHIRKIIKGNPYSRRIALTFDDGPHGESTLQLLTELKSLNVPATFFIVGKQAVKYPTLVQLEVIDGNEVGNHTFDHVNLTKINPGQVPYELDQCDAVLKHILGTSPRFFRPPGGQYDTDVIHAANLHGYITTLWSEDPGDYKRLPSDVILKRTMSGLHPGAIILLHDGIPQTMEMLPQFVEQARAEGYTFVTMSQLAAEPGAVP